MVFPQTEQSVAALEQMHRRKLQVKRKHKWLRGNVDLNEDSLLWSM